MRCSLVLELFLPVKVIYFTKNLTFDQNFLEESTDNESNPDLHRLVTRYQMHKCSAYCKRRRKCSGNTFITRCRFGFPCQVCENPKLSSVQESLKCRRRIYELPRSHSEVRVNDYNPLLLMLWKANMDIQFVAES